MPRIIAYPATTPPLLPHHWGLTLAHSQHLQIPRLARSYVPFILTHFFSCPFHGDKTTDGSLSSIRHPAHLSVSFDVSAPERPHHRPRQQLFYPAHAQFTLSCDEQPASPSSPQEPPAKHGPCSTAVYRIGSYSIHFPIAMRINPIIRAQQPLQAVDASLPPQQHPHPPLHA